VFGLALVGLIVCLLLSRKRKSAVEAQGKLGQAIKEHTESIEVQYWIEVGDHIIHELRDEQIAQLLDSWRPVELEGSATRQAVRIPEGIQRTQVTLRLCRLVLLALKKSCGEKHVFILLQDLVVGTLEFVNRTSDGTFHVEASIQRRPTKTLMKRDLYREKWT
jgi:hypothetical protein